MKKTKRVMAKTTNCCFKLLVNFLRLLFATLPLPLPHRFPADVVQKLKHRGLGLADVCQRKDF